MDFVHSYDKLESRLPSPRKVSWELHHDGLYPLGDILSPHDTLGSDPTCAPELRFGGCDSCDDATCRNLTQPKTCESNQPCPKADDGTTAARLGGNGALVTHMVMQFGQFVAHSFSMTSQAELDCCNKDFGHEECFNVDISYDPYYKDKRWC